MINWQSNNSAPAALKQLLDHRGSSTKLLSEYGEFGLRFLRQDWFMADDELREYLNVNTKKMMSREVLMHCDDLPWMYAESFFPQGSLEGEGEIFKTLGVTSLGSILFQDPTLERSAFEFAKLDASSELFQRAQQHQPDVQHLWARRSIFKYHDLPLAVVEVFYEHPNTSIPS